MPTDPALLATSAAAQGVEYCNELFLLERAFEGLDDKGRRVREPMNAEQRYTALQEQSKPVLDDFYAWLGEIRPVGGTKLAGAIQYCLNEKAYLRQFLENGSITVDNNRAENAIRPFVVGRKNWLFSTSTKGANAGAIIYSLAATAVANGLNVEEYFTELCRMKQILPWKEE